MKNATTRYPVVLVHGLFGFDTISGFPYWYGIPEALRSTGVKVVVAHISPVNENELRGQQLLEDIGKIREKLGCERVNLIGHSQGALTARYAAAVRPEWVASVTSVNGANHGSEVADTFRKAMTPGTLSEGLSTTLVKLYIDMVRVLCRKPQHPVDPVASLESVTTEGVARFNEKYPQGLPSTWGGEGNECENDVHYYSWSGVIRKIPLNEGPNFFDPLHTLSLTLSHYFDREAGQNDGLVGRYSSHLGKVICSNYHHDHFDAINQMAGLVPLVDNPLGLYIKHAAFLKSKGL